MSGSRQTFGLSADGTAVFLDVDGTLLGFKDHPDDVAADPPLRALLQRLHGATHGATALVSGRTLADLDRIMAPLVLAAGGTHGAELRFADGCRAPATGTALDAIRTAVAAFAADHPGLMVEDKGAALAIHYRRAPTMELAVRQFLDATVPQDDLMVQHGKLVAEVKSRGTSKGTAVAALMATPPFAGRRPLFIGDDLTDEHGFAAVNANGGVSVKVGAGATEAGERLAGVDEVRSFLSRLCAS